MRKKQAELAACRLIRGTGSNDPFEICAQLGIEVIECLLPENISGFYHKLNGCRLIYINSLLQETRKRLVCGHELGHAVLHEEMNTLFQYAPAQYPAGKWEKEADLFCATLLLHGIPRGGSVEELSRRTGLSKEIIEQKYQLY